MTDFSMSFFTFNTFFKYLSQLLIAYSSAELNASFPVHSHPSTNKPLQSSQTCHHYSDNAKVVIQISQETKKLLAIHVEIPICLYKYKGFIFFSGKLENLDYPDSDRGWTRVRICSQSLLNTKLTKAAQMRYFI